MTLNLNLHGSEKSRPQRGESGAHAFTAVALDHIAVGDDDTVEIPVQDGFNRVTGGAAVGNHESDQSMRAKPSSRAGQPMEQARLGGLFPSQVEDQVGKNQRAGKGMEEDYLVE